MTGTSQNGWPAAADAASVDIITVPVNLQSGQKKIALARAAAKPLVEMIEWWDRNIEPVTQIGGHVFREIRGQEGTGNLSNHASGTAIDINWDKHPLGASGTVPADKVAALRYEVLKRGLRWGGDYRGRKDEMHIEVNLPPSAFHVAQTALDTARDVKKTALAKAPTVAFFVGGGVLLTLAGILLVGIKRRRRRSATQETRG